jgi:hypothetical protein
MEFSNPFAKSGKYLNPLLSFEMSFDFALMPNDDEKSFYLFVDYQSLVFVEFHFTNEVKTPLNSPADWAKITF